MRHGFKLASKLLQALKVRIHKDELDYVAAVEEGEVGVLGAAKVRDAGDLLKIGALRLRRVAHENMPVCHVDVHALTQLASKGVELLGARAADAAAGKGIGVAHAVDEAAVVRDNVAAFEQRWVKVGEVIHDGGVPPAAGRNKEHAQLFHALHRADVCLGNLVVVVQEGLVHISCYQLVHASPFTCAPRASKTQAATCGRTFSI